MRSSNLRRIGVVVWPVVLGAVVFAACGSDESSEPTRSTLSLTTGSTAFVVKAPVTTTPESAAVFEDGTTPLAQEYEIQVGDWPLKVAEQFDVPLDDLINFNGWASANEFPFPGTVIKIPPGGIAQGTGAPAADDAAAGDGEVVADGDQPVGEAIPEAGDNCAEGTHTIQADDYPLKVADQYDVELAALEAANSANPAYFSFIPGETIVIPAKADC